METIEVAYRKLDSNGTYFHKYLIYTKNDHTQHAARGGPSMPGSLPISTQAEVNRFDTPYGAMITQHGLFDENFKDYKDNQGDHRELILTGSDLSSQWASITNKMDEIEARKLQYRPLEINSNTAVDIALGAIGFEPVQDDVGEYWSPGSGNSWWILEDGPIPDTNQGAPVPDDGRLPFPDFHSPYNYAENARSPLVLDLDGDGVETTGFGARASFDHDGNGFAEAHLVTLKG